MSDNNHRRAWWGIGLAGGGLTVLTLVVLLAVALVPRAPETVEAVLARTGYDLTAARGGTPVPAVFIAHLPRDLAEVGQPEARKDAFLQLLLPLVLRENGRLRGLRDRIRNRPAAIRAAVFERYGVAAGDSQTLLRRVDVIPPSLALAQAAIESGWGTSRFAREANNLFGQRIYGRAAKGVAPAGVDKAPFKLRAFGDIGASVRAYMHNINTHPAYADLRRARAALRLRGGQLTGSALAHALTRYSERKAAYVQQVRQIMRQNRLLEFDTARLRS
ncbi:MAG: glucosaminidase domain-containing protein [Alphaproteobacteria bacterium]|jgi:Bax protein|nr:glucosaminidase domain-containing protein [Alphaproteobacteria bacterium]MDP6564086.1 glucosaminidase domain-containing protein [Alphaproteobacteria bacterium]MDP6811938.1 glucosaminidase domain-containing protein [Alphaproteobacteria bacterium]